MAAPPRTPLPDLPKGHEFSPTTFSVSAEDVTRYVDAVGDGNAGYAEHGLAPPLAGAAHGLGAPPEAIELPGGSPHANQEVESTFIDEELDDDGVVVSKVYRGLRLRYAFRYEMEHLLARTGFEIEDLFGDCFGAPFGDTSPEMVFVARKPA